MRRFFRVGAVILITLPLILSSVVRAHSKAGLFTGLWEGVDPQDGSGVQSSISDIDQDGVFEIILRDTFFTFCKDVGANGEFGIVMSTGTIGEDGILRSEGTLTCDNGQEIMIGPAYKPVKKGAILVLTPDDPGTPPIILHRVSQPKKGAGNFGGPDDDEDED